MLNVMLNGDAPNHLKVSGLSDGYPVWTDTIDNPTPVGVVTQMTEADFAALKATFSEEHRAFEAARAAAFRQDVLDAAALAEE